MGQSAKGAVAKVEFNINPGYTKPTAVVMDPDKVKGALFEYAMARSFPCHITVHFRKEWGLPQVLLEYKVMPQAKTSRRVVVEVPTGAERVCRIVVFAPNDDMAL